MKKTLFVIALAVILLATLQAQDMARIDQLTRQMEQLAADFQAGRITAQEFQRRSEQLNNELLAAAQQAQNTGTTFTQAQLQRIEQLLDQSKSLEADRHNGRINQTQYDREINTINQELQSIYNTVTSPMAQQQLDEVQKRVHDIWPGNQPGWPTSQEWNNIITECGYGNFTQSIGTKASFSQSYESIRIYQFGGQQDVIFQELKSQIERITRGKVIGVFRDDNEDYQVDVINPRWPVPVQGQPQITTIYVSKYYGGIVLSIGVYFYYPDRHN